MYMRVELGHLEYHPKFNRELRDKDHTVPGIKEQGREYSKNSFFRAEKFVLPYGFTFHDFGTASVGTSLRLPRGSNAANSVRSVSEALSPGGSSSSSFTTNSLGPVACLPWPGAGAAGCPAWAGGESHLIYWFHEDK